jgi:PH (Pleckstrin Homology) domain-containing protein
MTNPPATPPPSPPGPGPHKQPTDAEIIYYQGSPPWRGLGRKLLLWPLAGVLLIAAPFILLHFDIHLPPTGWLVSILLGLGLPFMPILYAKTIRYRISNYRIDYERGLISKDIDTLELWHVEDLHFHQSLLDRMMGVGTIHVTSRDEKLPELFLRGLPNPRPIYETLKQRVIAVKRTQGVMKVDPG